MVQNRKPPAFQEYAANILADRNFRLMSLAERGLLFSMRLECWQNGNVPANPEELAKYLGYEGNDIPSLMSDRVMAFFQIQELNLICTEIEDYRKHLNDQRKKQSEGGKKGAQRVNARHRQLASDSQVTCRVGRESLVKDSLDQFSKIQPLESNDNQGEWINDYEQASNGS